MFPVNAEEGREVNAVIVALSEEAVCVIRLAQVYSLILIGLEEHMVVGSVDTALFE